MRHFVEQLVGFGLVHWRLREIASEIWIWREWCVKLEQKSISAWLTVDGDDIYKEERERERRKIWWKFQGNEELYRLCYRQFG